MNLVKRSLGVRKAGHSGTLDPLASGLMLVATEGVTRLLSLLIGRDKGYLAEFRLGIVTDTLDITGSVLEEKDSSGIRPSQVIETARAYSGIITQKPPRYSALKVHGRRAHDLARAGESFELAEREVRISFLSVSHISGADYRLALKCSSGTYVRSLIDDIGRSLGPGAVMTSLRRESIGGVSLSHGRAPQLVTPEDALAPSLVFPELPRRYVDGDDLAALRRGKSIAASDHDPDGGPILIFRGLGESWEQLVGVYDASPGLLIPRYVFPSGLGEQTEDG